MANTLHLIRIPADVSNLIGENTYIDPNKFPLKKIVKHYHVKPEIQCSLSMCHRWHNEGYIVELEDGRLTNVGHICGKQFGDIFAIEEQKYQEQNSTASASSGNWCKQEKTTRTQTTC